MMRDHLRRISRLEQAAGAASSRLVVVEGETTAEVEADINRRIRAGSAASSDCFILTGVRRHSEWEAANGIS